MDVLILNTLVMDIRGPEFAFADELVGPGGLAKCATRDMPAYPQARMHAWMQGAGATAGGPGNTAPLVARAGLDVAVGGNLGRGDYEGVDAQGRAFHDVMTANGVDMSATRVHPELPTGTTFIHDRPGDERGGIAYFPNANNDFDFEAFKPHVERLDPTVVYYMYSGLSDRGDAHGGRDLAAFIAWCRARGSITIVDSHTLCADPEALIAAGTPVAEYRLLEPLLPEVDLFFTSWDEARMIRATLDRPGPAAADPAAAIPEFLEWMATRFWREARPRLCGVTVKDGAFAVCMDGDGHIGTPRRFTSRFMCGEVVDLVGAGDSFRAGLITYVARHATAFRDGTLAVDEAVQVGNLVASLYIKAPLNDRYGNLRDYGRLLQVVQAGGTFPSFDALKDALDA